MVTEEIKIFFFQMLNLIIFLNKEINRSVEWYLLNMGINFQKS